MQFSASNKIKHLQMRTCLLTIPVLFLLLMDCQSQQEKRSRENRIFLANQTKAVVQKVVEVDMDSLRNIRWNESLIVTDASGREYIYQLLKNERKLLLWVSLKPGAPITLFIRKGKANAFMPMVYGRQVPERFDDFAWENNLIAYRIYGLALEKTNESAKGIDVWSKRTNRLIIDKWYKNGNYHTDNGEGGDFYKVGFTLGAGDVAPFVGDSILFPPNYRGYKIIYRGPLRFCFELYYDSVVIGKHRIKMVKRITLDAGEQLNKMEASFINPEAKNMKVAIGIVKRQHGAEAVLDRKNGILSYWEPETPPNGRLGVAILFPNSGQIMQVDSQHYLAISQLDNKGAITYHFGAAWNKAHKINSADEWYKYLLETKKANPVKIRYSF